MSVATSTAIGIAGVVGAAGALGGSAIASSGASNAANTQASAANNAAQLQSQEAQNALNFQQGTYGNQQQELAPYANVGYSGLANLAYLTGAIPGAPGSGVGGGAGLQNPIAGVPNSKLAASPGADGGTGGTGSTGIPGVNAPSVGGAGTPAGFGINIPQGTSGLSSLVNPSLGASGSLLAPYPGGQFSAPTGLTEQNDPGYQARLALGDQSVQNSAAAQGNLLSGNTLRSLAQFGQDYGSNEYGNVYNRALNTYDTNYNAYEQNQTNTYNRLASLAGIGQTATQQLGSSGSSAANQVGNTALTAGSQIGQDINNAGAARATGYQNTGNILGSAVGSAASLLPLLNGNNPYSASSLANYPIPTDPTYDPNMFGG